MSKPHYPPLSEATLTPFRAIEIQLQNDPDFLDRPECPYPPMIKAMLRRLAGGQMAVATGTEDAQALVDAGLEGLDIEIAKLFLQVKQDINTYTGSDPKDKMAFTRTAQDLLSKIVDMQAKRYNVRNFARAQAIMVEVLEEFLTPAQRTTFLTKLESLNNVQ